MKCPACGDPVSPGILHKCPRALVAVVATPSPRGQQKDPEHQEQRALFEWAEKYQAQVPALQGLFAVPNGRGRSKMEAGKLKAEGVKRGVPDVWLPVPAGDYTGLVIEMKAPGKLGTVSEDQAAWHAFLRIHGWLVVVTDHWRGAWNLIVRYLGRPELCLEIPPKEVTG